LFNNKNILVTGASSGIGHQISIDIANNNGNLIATGTNENKLSNLCLGLNNNNKKSSYLLADLTNETELIKLSDDIPEISGLVINAGIIDYSPIKFISSVKMYNIFQINFFSNVILIKNLLKKGKIKNNSSIVFIGSISADLATPATSIYAASKAALTTYSKVLASELVSKKIRVNTISPGLIKTKLIEKISEFNIKSDEYPLGLGNVHDVSNQVLFLLSDKSKWITGTNVIIDGGYSLKL
tara:strand:- start:999 stop:1721 length:723 start_codon:yes stop_codon:yes gene_type:complete